MNTNSSQVTIASGLNILAGLWLIISPFILAYPEDSNSSMWNAIIVGALVAIIAAARVWAARAAGWLSWVNAALGVWLIASPWIFGNSEFAAVLWNDIVVGAIIVVLGAWSALATETRSV